MEIERKKEQESEWIAAQQTVINVDLLSAAKQQLQFLAAVDKNGCLYEGPALHKAVYRYNACWLPLLAKHSETPICEGPLVVPLDCEWIWHCHRLNPIRYRSDCLELYGRVLNNKNVVSSTQGMFDGGHTEEIWNRLYPDEPYELDSAKALSPNSNEKFATLEKFTRYDLTSAVKRQSSFFYQVCRPHMSNDVFLQGAIGRYKGFLHMIKRNKERSIKSFSVPTYDIDLIWHTHMLNPISYCKDVHRVLGKILEHDDTDLDRTKGKKLDVGFSKTTKQWEKTFGSRYWKAGAMYRGNSIVDSNFSTNDIFPLNDSLRTSKLSNVKIVEVLLEVIEVKNLPQAHEGDLVVTFSKAEPDSFLKTNRKLHILSASAEKHVASFHCEPKGELLFELASNSPSESAKIMGRASLSLQDLLEPVQNLAVEKWVEMQPSSGKVTSKPICLRIALSFTPPIQVPHAMLNIGVTKGNATQSGGCSGCGGGCGGCRAMVNAAGNGGCSTGVCGSGCGGGCGNVLKSSGCGGGCGGCGGGGCGGGCGHVLKSSGCGSGCAGCGAIWHGDTAETTTANGVVESCTVSA